MNKDYYSQSLVNSLNSEAAEREDNLDSIISQGQLNEVQSIINEAQLYHDKLGDSEPYRSTVSYRHFELLLTTQLKILCVDDGTVSVVMHNNIHPTFNP